MVSDTLQRTITDVVIGFDKSRSGEENYFYCKGINDDVVVQAAIDYLWNLMNDGSREDS